ncbi:glycine-rich protein DOT1-like [Arachis stenosperma]|uniref:glycine-rich protein DOT1-like n=1 Tax=Arachis stenosperma TaxID=217475 RepID=UPI0025AB98AD|nr:glycine-rich protein DOT1-like [Arachis stenosperma]
MVEVAIVEWWHQYGWRFLSPKLFLEDSRADATPTDALLKCPKHTPQMDQVPEILDNCRVERRRPVKTCSSQREGARGHGRREARGGGQGRARSRGRWEEDKGSSGDEGVMVDLMAVTMGGDGGGSGYDRGDRGGYRSHGGGCDGGEGGSCGANFGGGSDDGEGGGHGGGGDGRGSGGDVGCLGCIWLWWI